MVFSETENRKGVPNDENFDFKMFDEPKIPRNIIIIHCGMLN
jgi:hypothetical protein